MTLETSLAMETQGRGPHLLLLHGAGGSPRDSFPFIDHLSERYTVLAPHLPGVGQSELGATPLTVPDVARRVLAAMDDAGIERFAVCGYSMGTLIASWLAAHAPERVATIILTAGFARPLWSCQDAMDRWETLLDADPVVLGRFIVDGIYTKETIRARGTKWYAAAMHDAGRGFPAGTRAHIDLIRNADVRAEVALSRQPTLIVVPRHDAFVTPDHSVELQRLRPDARVEYLEAGHAVGDEQERAWLNLLTEFLEHHTSISPTLEGTRP